MCVVTRSARRGLLLVGIDLAAVSLGRRGSSPDSTSPMCMIVSWSAHGALTDADQAGRGADDAVVADLAAILRVERREVEEDLDVLTFFSVICASSRLSASSIVTICASLEFPTATNWSAGLRRRRCRSALLRGSACARRCSSRSSRTGRRHCETCLGRELLRKREREAERRTADVSSPTLPRSSFRLTAF